MKINPLNKQCFSYSNLRVEIIWDEQSFLYSYLIMLQSGDIELNTGPLNIYKEVTKNLKKNDCKLNIFHVYCQSIVHKKGQLEVMMQVS